MTPRRRFLKTTALAALGLASSKGPRCWGGTNTPSVVIVGGGFGGLNAALALRALLPAARITVIDSNPTPLHCPGSNAVIAGLAPMGAITASADRLLEAKGIRQILGTVSAVDAHRKRLTLETGAALPYDRLIVATGIGFRWDALEGYNAALSQRFPHAWQAGPQTELLRRQIAALPAGGVVLITAPVAPYRCPPGPYERASLIAHRLSRDNPRAKIIVLDAKSRFPKETAFKAAWARLYPGRIEWISLDTEGPLDHLDARNQTLVTAFGRFKADVLNLIPDQKASPLAERLGLTDTSGWCPVFPANFESRTMKDVHVIGDAAALGPLPKSAFAAQNEARHCALAVALSLNGQPAPDPELINHCYSLVAPDQAISVTGRYRLNTSRTGFETRLLAESGPSDDPRAEALETRDWLRLLYHSTFGNPNL